jgi:hypothetical protein
MTKNDDSLNLEWIPEFLINFELSNTEFIENKNNQNNYITINILFLSSKCLKLYISRNVKFEYIEEWLYQCIEYYNSNFTLNSISNLIFIHETKIIKNKNLSINTILDKDITNFNINCIIKKRNNTPITAICTSTNLDVLCYNHHIQTIIIDNIGCECNCAYEDKFDDISCSGILIPINIDPFNFPNIIPDEYINIFTIDEWEELKCKINNKIISLYKYLDLSDEEVDKIEQELEYDFNKKYLNEYDEFEIDYLDNKKHPFSRFYNKISKEYYFKSMHRDNYKPKIY